jgi:hypothetical protein
MDDGSFVILSDDRLSEIHRGKLSKPAIDVSSVAGYARLLFVLDNGDVWEATFSS